MYDKAWYAKNLKIKSSDQLHPRSGSGFKSISFPRVYMQCPVCQRDILCVYRREGADRSSSLDFLGLDDKNIPQVWRSREIVEHAESHSLEDLERAWYFQVME